MNDIKLELLASLPAFELGVEGSYLAALGRIVGASPTAINPSERAELLQWLVNGLQKDVWSEPVTLRAVQAIKVLGRNPVGSDVLATSPALETLVRCAALPMAKPPLSSSFRPPSSPTLPCSLSPTQKLASFFNRSHSPSSAVIGSARTFGDALSDEVLRVLANVGLLHADARARLAMLGAGEGLVAGMQSIIENEQGSKARGDLVFVVARLLFLLTISGGQLLVDLVEKANLPSTLDMLLIDQPHVQQLDPLPELLKLTYNVLSMYPRLSATRVRLNEAGRVWEGIEEEHVSPAAGGAGEWWDEKLGLLLAPILDIFATSTPPANLPLSPTLSQALACLLPFPAPDFVTRLTDRHQAQLLAIWDCTSSSFAQVSQNPKSDELVEREMPVLALVLARLAGVDAFRHKVFAAFFPDDLDRSAESMPLQDRPGNLGRAIRLMLAPADMAQTRQAVGELLFALSDRDANQMCELVGYGNAAGFLLTKGFSSPSKTSAPSAACPTAAPKAHVSPITALEADPAAPMHDPTMTDEDKEREAERLFVLFERIKKNAAVSLGDGKDDTLDPIRSAVESGRFQEMDESTEEERKRLDAQDAADEAEALREVQAVRARRGEGAKQAE